MKAQKPNKPWLGPDLDKMAAAFVTAFVKRQRKPLYFDFLAGQPLPLAAFGVQPTPLTDQEANDVA